MPCPRDSGCHSQPNHYQHTHRDPMGADVQIRRSNSQPHRHNYETKHVQRKRHSLPPSAQFCSLEKLEHTSDHWIVTDRTVRRD